MIFIYENPTLQQLTNSVRRDRHTLHCSKHAELFTVIATRHVNSIRLRIFGPRSLSTRSEPSPAASNGARRGKIVQSDREISPKACCAERNSHEVEIARDRSDRSCDSDGGNHSAHGDETVGLLRRHGKIQGAIQTSQCARFGAGQGWAGSPTLRSRTRASSRPAARMSITDGTCARTAAHALQKARTAPWGALTAHQRTSPSFYLKLFSLYINIYIITAEK